MIFYNKMQFFVYENTIVRVGIVMENYRFTAFEKTGETLFDEVWTFENDDVAKVEGQKRIEENGVAEKTHRLVNSSGKLLLFHV